MGVRSTQNVLEVLSTVIVDTAVTQAVMEALVQNNIGVKATQQVLEVMLVNNIPYTPPITEHVNTYILL